MLLAWGHLQIIHPHHCLVTLSWCRHSVTVCNWKHNFICRWHDNLCKFWKGSSIKWNYEMSQLLSELNSISHQSACNQYCHIQPFDHGFATPSSPLLGNKESHTQKAAKKTLPSKKLSTMHEKMLHCSPGRAFYRRLHIGHTWFFPFRCRLEYMEASFDTASKKSRSEEGKLSVIISLTVFKKQGWQRSHHFYSVVYVQANIWEIFPV